ncbi:MAG: hypothetical protein JXA67_02230, partial [Micromonosporaceae bacterium]|nr:hypothetical protein [Micromonosporaceae bacterium]
RPSWRNLPALAWLAVRRLDTKLQAAPVLGPVAAWCAAPLMLLTLACAHTNGHLAAKERHAALWIRTLSTTGRGVHTPREMLITAAAFLPPGPVLLLAIGISSDTQASTLARVIALALAGTIVVGPLLALFGVNRRRDLTTRTGQQHRRLATQTSTPLVVVQGLVADTTTGAGTALIRALRAHADQLGVGTAAVARDERLLPGYLANGLVQTELDPASRLLYRPPGTGRRCDLSRNDD